MRSYIEMLKYDVPSSRTILWEGSRLCRLAPRVWNGPVADCLLFLLSFRLSGSVLSVRVDPIDMDSGRGKRSLFGLIVTRHAPLGRGPNGIPCFGRGNLDHRDSPGANSDLLGIYVEASVELDLLQAHLLPLLSEHHPISARTLGAIEGLVGGLEHLLRARSSISAVGHTDADRHGHFLS